MLPVFCIHPMFLCSSRAWISPPHLHPLCSRFVPCGLFSLFFFFFFFNSSGIFFACLLWHILVTCHFVYSLGFWLTALNQIFCFPTSVCVCIWVLTILPLWDKRGNLYSCRLILFCAYFNPFDTEVMRFNIKKWPSVRSALVISWCQRKGKFDRGVASSGSGEHLHCLERQQ